MIDHELRRKGIGGSDVAAIVGLIPYRTAVDVWLEKTARVAPPDDNLRMKIGRLSEPVVAQLYADETGLSLIKGVTLQHRALSFVVGSPDYLVRDEPKGVEIKTTGYFDPDQWGPPQTDEIPMSYLVQAMWYMFLTDRPAWDLAALASNRDFRIYHLTRDEALVALLLDAAARFWRECVMVDVPPPLESTAAAERWLQYRYGTQTTDTFVTADQTAVQWSETLRHVGAQIDALEATRQAAEVQLKLAIGDAAGIEGATFRHSWKQAREGQDIDWEAVARELHASPELIAQHTTVRPGTRRFLTKWLNSKGA